MNTEMSQDAGFVVSGRNYGLVPMQGQATDAETQLARLEDFMNAGYDADAAKRAREYYGEGVPIEHISEEDKSFFAGAAFARIKGVPNNPEAYWHAQKKDIPDVEREQMFELLGAELRQQVRSRWDERQARIKAVEESLGRMDVYVRGDEFGEAFSEQDLANVRGVMDAETMADAEAVRAWMRTYMLPLAGKDDAEEVLRTVDGLEDEFFEVIGTSPRRAEMAYNAMLHWAEGMKQSGKVGVADEFIVGVGKKISNWGKAAHLMAPAVAMAPVGNPDFPIMLSDEAMAGQQAELASRHEEYARHKNARSILRAAINKSLELGDNVSWWKGAARTASQMAGDSSAYLLPGVGMYTGTADLLMGGATETVDRFALQGLSGDAAAGQAAIETGVQALVELTPWGRVGGKGFSAFTRRYFGEAIEKGTAGKLSRWVVRNTQNSTMRALVAEGTVSFVDEGILEPIAGGLMTYGAEQAADVLGIPHGQSREFTACFDELKALYTDPYQAAGLFLFTAGLTGAGAYGVRENVRYFAKHRKMWEAAGLAPEQVDRVMAADDRVELGGKLVREGWESDPAGMRERVLKANKDIAERGEVLVLTGEGALDAELENSELAPAYRAVWQEYQDEGLLPKVEAVGNNQFRITKESVDITLDAQGADAYLQHAIDEVDSIQTRELQQRLGKEHFIDLRAELADAVSTIAGNAAMRAAEAAGERTGIAVTDITKGLPEWLADGIVKRGQITLKDAQDITEWAIGRIDGLVQEGMSPADARLTRASADGMARTLGDWSTFARDFSHREQMAGLQAGTGAISISRTRNEQAVTFDGRQVLGQTIMTLPGNVRHQGAVEDVTESFADMMVQQRAQAIREANPDSSPAEAENAAWQELGEVVQRARAAVLKADAEAEIEEVKPGDKMSIIEALSTMATSKFVASGAVPGWMQGLTAALKGNLAAADSLAKVRAAYASVLQNDPSAVSELDAMLDKLGVYVQDTFREARVDAVDIQAWKHAHALVTARAESPAGSGGAPVSEVVQEAERTEAEIGKNDERFSGTGVPRSEVEGARESQEILNGMVPGSNAPAGMQGVFVDDKCYYNAAGGFWCGMIDKHKLRDGTEQVKVGAKGKHGVIAGRELTGKFQQNVGAIYVWKRTNGELQVISGRHRFAKLMEDDSAQSCNAYVFEEDAEHDERWARMLDYENNMRDDQADEVTAATYVRETGLSDTELEVRGLMRNGTRCKRGALIGRFAREELWTRFINGAVKPMDAEVICNLTRSIRDQGRVEEIQRRCCMLLDEKKSWEYIGAMVQLMANKENVVMKQGLLDFGADFEADLARAAEWIERNIKAINESVSLLKQGRKLSGKKRAEAERLGITTATQEGTEQMLYDLEQLRAQFEMIGSYPDLVAAAQMWDGKTEVDPVAQYLERARAEREQVRAEGEMDVEEYLAEQARKEAVEAVPSLFSMEMEKRKLEDNQVKISNKAIVTFKDGVVRGSKSHVLRSDGREEWAQFPEISELKAVGLPRAGIYMEVGDASYGFLHLAIRHAAELEELYPDVSVSDAVEMFVDEVFSKLSRVHGSFVGKGRKKKVEADTARYERKGKEKKKRVTLRFNKSENKEYYTFISAFEADADKPFSGAKVEKDGLTCAVTVELDGKAPGLPTGATLKPSSARQQHSRRPVKDDNITPNSKVKGEDIDFEFLRKAKHPDVETGARFRDTNFSASLTAVTPEMDERYMAAVKRGDMDAAARMVHDVARMRGYMADSDYQGSECFNGTAPSANAYFDTDDERYEAWENGDFEGTVSLADFVRRGMDSGELEWLVTSPGAYQRADKYKRESIDAIRKAKASKRGKVTIYRAVPADIKEGSVRNGDWVTLSKAYAEYHISLQDWEKGRIIKQAVSMDDVWWDGNDVNEWGYDDGKEYAYRNTANNRKLLDAVTYDQNGDVVPLSRRFDYSSPDVSFHVIGQKAKTWDKYKGKAFAGRDDGMLRAEIDASQSKLKWGVLRGKNVAAYRRIIADWDTLPKEERQVVESFAELCWERDEASKLLNEASGEEFPEVYRKARKLADEVDSKRAEVREVIGRFFQQKGADGSAAISVKNEIIDAMSTDFWAEWASDKVEEVLKSDPLAFGMNLQDVLDYPELYEAYPQLGEVPVYTEDLKGYNGLAGSNGWGDYIMMNRSLLDDWERFHSVLLHEVQHVIQRIEGFAKGGNKESVQRKVKELLEGTEARMEFLERDLRWFSAVDIARDFLKDARRLRRYPNAWKRSGQRFRFARMSSSAEEVREAILRDIAERYEAFRREDTGETLLLEMEDSLLPVVHFSSLAGIEAGLAALDKIKSRKLAFRGTAAKKNRRLADLQKRYNGIKRVLDEFVHEPYELYVRLAGEIEARNVQSRLNWTVEQRAARPFNDTLEYPGEVLVTYSMERASLRALNLLTIRADERAGEQLIKDWQAACENWGRFGREDAGRLGNGAKMLGEIQALIGATKGVLPERYCRMGHLNGLMRWAAIYARMQQDGTLPQVGEIKGPIYQKFLDKLQQADELNRLQGMSEQEAQEAMALLAGERLDTAMLKVARECRRRLELFLKDRELERIEHIVEKAYPKRQNGQKWPRGKMAADAYRRMERAREYMNLPADEVAERINDAKRKLDALDATDTDFERKEEELEEEISLLQTFGCWENMGFEQARRACGVMTEMVLLGRAKWKEKLQAERRRANYDRAQISRNFRTKLADVQSIRAKTDAKEKARKRTIGKKLAMGTMSYSQLMLALEPQLGKEFTGRHMRMIAKAHERLQTGTQQLHRRMYSTLSEITGLKTEGEMEEWLKSNNEIIDTGIVLKPRITETCRMTPEEVEEWLALSKAQRDARRKQAEEEAAATGELPDNVPSEEALERMREKLEASRKADTTPKEYVVTIEKRYESPLHCTKEAMLFAILTFEQEDYTRLMDVNGVNEKALQRMRELVGDKLLRWGYAMREILNEQGLTMAAIYEAHTGVPFAKRANYFRGVFDIAKVKDKGESIDSATSITGGKYGCLIPRQYHHQMLNWGTSATQVFIGTYKEQQNYICTSHITREWRTLLSNQGFEKRLRAEIGDAALDMIHGWCKMIDGSVIADAKVNAMMNRMFGRVMGAYAVSRLAGNVYTIIKQVSAVLNGFVGGYVPEQVLAGDAVAQQLVYRHIGLGEYAAALARAMSGQTEISAEEIANAGFIAGRKRVEGSHLEEAAMLAPGQSVPGKVGRAGRAVYEANMDAIGYVDRKCNTLAALAVADAVYRTAKRENKNGLVPDAELRRVAIETAGMVIDRAAQPQLRTQKGYWAAGGGAFGAMGNFFYMFKSEVLGKLGLYVGQMFAGHHGAWIGGALSFGVLNSLVLALIDYVRGYWPGDDEEDKWKPAKQFIWNVFANDISAVPVLGDLEGWARSTVLGGRQWNSSLVDMVVPFKDMYTYGKREVKYISEDESWDKHVQALCGFARALGAAGGWWQGNSRVAVGSCAELALAAAAISNIVRFGKDVVKKVEGEEE